MPAAESAVRMDSRQSTRNASQASLCSTAATLLSSCTAALRHTADAQAFGPASFQAFAADQTPLPDAAALPWLMTDVKQGCGCNAASTTSFSRVPSTATCMCTSAGLQTWPGPHPCRIHHSLASGAPEQAQQPLRHWRSWQAELGPGHHQVQIAALAAAAAAAAAAERAVRVAAVAAAVAAAVEIFGAVQQAGLAERCCLCPSAQLWGWESPLRTCQLSGL